MSIRHTTKTIAAAAALALFGAQAAVAVPDGYVLRDSTSLEAKSAIEDRAQPSAQPRVTPDGYQPQLGSSAGSVASPDNELRDRPGGTSTPVSLAPAPIADGFDWSDAILGGLAGVALVAFASAVMFAASRAHTLARA
jgi:hypothetical protein